MASLNRLSIIGNITKDPEIRQIPNGDSVGSFSVAVNESYKDKDGNKKESTEFVNVVVWRALAEIAGKYLKKGSQVYIEGKIQTRAWDDKEGNKRYTTELVARDFQMLGSKGGSASSDSAPQSEQQPQMEFGSGQADAPEDDGLPF